MRGTLQHMAEDAAIDDKVLQYLEARKLGNHGILATVADTFQEIDDLLWKPWCDGTTIDGAEFKLPEDQHHLAKAALRFLWQQARRISDQQAKPKEPNPAHQPTPPVEAPDEKKAKTAPKELQQDVLQQLVADYEKSTINGRKREFPMKLLLGAEKIVSRCWHEHHVSKAYTPLQLNEIMEARCFDSSGQLNTLSPQFKTKSQGHKLTVDKDMTPVVIEEESTWTPRGILSILDAIEAVAHCWVLIGLAHELDVLKFTNWWVNTFRAKPNKLEQLKGYWLEAGWRLALQMRQGEPFEIVTAQIMEDTAALQNAIMKETPKPKGSGKTENKNANSPTKGKGRNWPSSPSGHGRGPYRSEPWARDSNQQWSDKWRNSTNDVVSRMEPPSLLARTPRLGRDSTGPCPTTAGYPTQNHPLNVPKQTKYGVHHNHSRRWTTSRSPASWNGSC